MNCIKCGQELPDDAVFCPACGKKQAVQHRRSARTRGNGTGSAYREGGSWCASAVVAWRLSDDGKLLPVRRKKRGFKTKREALEYIPKLSVASAKTVPTIADLWQTYQMGAYKKLSANKQSAYKIAYNKLKPIWYTKIDALTVGDLQSLLTEKAPTYYPAKDMRDLLSHFYKLALPDQFVHTNHALLLSLPELEESVPNPFTPQEQAAIWQDYAAGHIESGYILLMIYTGMMPAELLQAAKSSIDWERKEILGAGKKTKKRRSTPIVLADIILPVLHDLCDASDSDRIVDVSRDKFYELFHDTLQRTGCRTDLKPYSCRHTTATALAEADIPPVVIQQVMRHAKFDSTRRYIHMSDARAKEAVNHIRQAEQ